MKFILEKEKMGGIIFYFDYDQEVYPLNSSSKNKIIIYQKELFTPFIDDKFDIKFEQLVRVIINYLYQDTEDSDEGDCMILLDETEKMKSILENTYKKHMKKEQYKDYVEKLYFLNIELQNKLAMINYQNKFGYAEENTHRR